MRTSSNAFLAMVAATLGIFLFLGQIKSVEVPAVAEVPIEQYRVIDLSVIPVENRKTAPLKLEAILNEQAAQGWRVREVMDAYIILAR